MDKLIFAFLTLAALTSCAKIQFVNISNNTKSDLSAKAIFVNKHGEHEMDLPIEREGYNFWRYEVSPWETSILQESFVKLQAANKDGCSIEYDRAALEAKAIKKTMWEITIEQQEFADACSSPKRK